VQPWAQGRDCNSECSVCIFDIYDLSNPAAILSPSRFSVLPLSLSLSIPSSGSDCPRPSSTSLDFKALANYDHERAYRAGRSFVFPLVIERINSADRADLSRPTRTVDRYPAAVRRENFEGGGGTINYASYVGRKRGKPTSSSHFFPTRRSGMQTRMPHVAIPSHDDLRQRVLHLNCKLTVVIFYLEKSVSGASRACPRARLCEARCVHARTRARLYARLYARREEKDGSAS